jgi:hypothetical protein
MKPRYIVVSVLTSLLFVFAFFAFFAVKLTFRAVAPLWREMFLLAAAAVGR